MFGSGALSYQQGVVVGDRAVFVPTVGSRERHGYVSHVITYRINRFMELVLGAFKAELNVARPNTHEGLALTGEQMKRGPMIPALRSLLIQSSLLCSRQQNAEGAALALPLRIACQLQA